MNQLLINIIKVVFIFLFINPITSTGNLKFKPPLPESLISIQYIDETQPLNIEESELPSQQFSDYKNQELNPNQYYWFKLTFNNSNLPNSEYVIHAYDFLTEIYLVQFGPDNSISNSIGGTLIPAAKRSLNGFYKDKVLFKVSEKDKTTVYLKIRRYDKIS